VDFQANLELLRRLRAEGAHAPDSAMPASVAAPPQQASQAQPQPQEETLA